jgi:hypothetical protein
MQRYEPEYEIGEMMARDDGDYVLYSDAAALEATVRERDEQIAAQNHILDASTNYKTWKNQNDKIAALESEIVTLKSEVMRLIMDQEITRFDNGK